MQQEHKKEIIPSVVVDEEKRAILVHKEYELSNRLLKEPLRKMFKIEALDINSFVSLVNEYKNETTKLFFSTEQIQGAIDYDTPEKGSFKERGVVLNLTKSTFYKAFKRGLEGNLSQRDFVALLKSLYPFITQIDGKPCDNMDVIEVAESLQAVKKFDSVQKNTSSKFSLDVEIKSGAKESLTLPRYIVFCLPVYECSQIKGDFQTELFVDIDSEGKFSIKLTCFTQPISEKEVLEKVVEAIKEQLEDVSSYYAQG